MERRELPGCAVVAREAGDEPVGSAPLVRSWVLIEHPVAWAADAHKRVPPELLTPRAAAALARLSDAGQLKAMLIRRTGRRPVAGGRTVLVGSAGWIERLDYADLATPIDVDLDAVAAGGRGHGEPVEGPTFLVCTHGTRDLCCAANGRPVAAALAAAHPGRVWESSHQGGHRFAANLMVLPDAVAYGRMDPPTALRAAAAAYDGELLLDAEIRGSTLVGGFEQAAELAVRRRIGIAAAPGVATVDNQTAGGADRARVTVRAGERTFAVVVRRDRADVASLSRCGDIQPQRHVVEELRELAPAL